jgi:hypothetical protein
LGRRNGQRSSQLLDAFALEIAGTGFSAMICASTMEHGSKRTDFPGFSYEQIVV